MYSIHNVEKLVDAERFIRNLKTKIYKYMTSTSKNVYTNKLDDIVNEYNKTVGDHVRISWSEEAFVIKKLKIQFHGHMLLMILMVKKLLEQFKKKNFKRQIKKNLG